MTEAFFAALESLSAKDWISFGIGAIGILVALLAATFFASRQQRKTLVQNLDIETYREMWNSLSAVNQACTTFAALANLKLNFLETKINSPPRVGEKSHDYDYRRRTEIQEYTDEYNKLLSDISGTFLDFHRQWEQNEPIVHRLAVAFDAYKEVHNELQERTQFPSKERSHLDIDNFSDFKPIIEKENAELTEDYLQLMVYGMDFGRLLQEELIAKYYKRYKPTRRAVNATVGKELTRKGLRDIK